MFTRPDDLTDAQVAAALLAGWGIDADEIEHAAVGFGSHHWRVVADGQRWFLSIDDLESRRRTDGESRTDASARLRAALTAATQLQSNGLDFVVAPRPALDGSLLHPIGRAYVLAVYRHIDGQTSVFGSYDTDEQRVAVVDRVAEIHRSTHAVRSVAVQDDFLIPSRDALEATLDEPGRWGPGPFAAPARALLRDHVRALRAALKRYDALAAAIAARHAEFVITHGEPHRANTIDTASGLMLIDWDTALLAPAERDLWMLVSEDAAVADRYTALTGRQVDTDAIELYTLWWDLCEISLYVADLRHPHEVDADTRTAWKQLQEYLDPDRWGAT